MGEAFKNMINKETLAEFAVCVKKVYKPFPLDEFIETTIDETWESLELKARGNKICVTLHKFLPEN